MQKDFPNTEDQEEMFNESGQISMEEWDKTFPDKEPDFWERNYGDMADEAYLHEKHRG